MKSPSYLSSLTQIENLTQADRKELQPVSDRFAFRSNSYYQSLINWSDPLDPIRRIVVPSIEELSDWGRLDASDECSYTPVPGLEHKYSSTALLLVTDICGAYCRFCFRKRLFQKDNNEVPKDITLGVRYIEQHPEISNVLLTGGDPLILPTRRLTQILTQLEQIQHVNIVRIGSKMPVFNPGRILNDETLITMFRTFTRTKCIYLMAHVNHPQELTEEAIKGFAALQSVGVVTVNQTPILRGINDDAGVLAELCNKLAAMGVSPYYIFHCRPTLGNESYALPLEQAYALFAEAQCRISGLAKRARFVMSHTTGKVEVVGLSGRHIYMRYHQAANPADANRMLVFRSNPAARWLDDYEEMSDLAFHPDSGSVLTSPLFAG